MKFPPIGRLLWTFVNCAGLAIVNGLLTRIIINRHANMGNQSLLILTAMILVAVVPCAHAQENYEIQVYGAETVPPETTMVELHSNFTARGSKTVVDGVEPTNRAMHETIEITQGITKWFETGFYIFTSIQPDGGWQWVGDHIRPRVAIPASWHWPVGLSLSNEIGYQRARFSSDTWTWEIRPIVDKKIGRWYLSFNPTLDRSFHGASVHRGVEFSPDAKVSFDFTKRIAGGLEYYAAYGPLSGFDPLSDQQQQFFPSIDVDFGPQWEFNLGAGIGTTRSTDHLIIKCILGRRFSWKHARQTALR